MSAEATTATVIPTNAAAFMQPTPGSLPADYVESDPAQRSQAKLAHILGIFGILGTGIYYLVKKNEAGPFAKDQMKEAFNFQLLVFCVQVAVSIAGTVAGMAVALLATVFSLVSLAIFVGVIVLLVKNCTKAGNGQVARYPARLSVLK
jgi:uncharacterized Tic20 family protein